MERPLTCCLCESLGSNDGNFLPNTDEAKRNHARLHFMETKMFDDEITEDEILQRCFAAQPKLERSASKSECRQALLNICKSLLKNLAESTTAMCNVCGTEISIKDWNRNSMIKHASAHLEVKLIKCRHCDRSSSDVGWIRFHIRRVHNISKPTNDDFEDKTVEYFDAIANQIKHCFSADNPRAFGIQHQFVVRNHRSKSSRRSVVHMCHSIFIQRSKPSSMECNICGAEVSLRGRYFMGTSMFQHAAAHLDVKLFTCRHCNKSMSSKCGMTQHLSNVHQIIDGTSDDFDDQSEKYHSEYLNMIERCFSADHVKPVVPPSSILSTIKAEKAIRSQTTGSSLTVERHLFCNRLINTIVDSDGKIQCSLCSKRLAVKTSIRTVSNGALIHAELHLQKLLYRCKVCKNSFTTKPVVARHLKKQHALGMEKNHECVADEFHEEFMAMLSKCYTSDGIHN